jgi:hypothetical protein
MASTNRSNPPRNIANGLRKYPCIYDPEIDCGTAQIQAKSYATITKLLRFIRNPILIFKSTSNPRFRRQIIPVKSIETHKASYTLKATQFRDAVPNATIHYIRATRA